MNDPYLPGDDTEGMEFSLCFLANEVSNALTTFNGPHQERVVEFALQGLRVDGEHDAESPLTALQIIDAFREYARKHKLPWPSFIERVEKAIKEAKP